MITVDVAYHGRFYQAIISIRESLFYELRQCDPERKVVIFCETHKLIVPLKELELYSVWRLS